MRRIFRRIGSIRFIFGVVIVVISFTFRSDLGETWTGVLILVGAAVGVSGMMSMFLIIAYNSVLPFAFIGVIWLAFEVWDGAYYSDTLRKYYGFVYALWAMGLFAAPIGYWYHNKSWFFMVRNFSIDEKPNDTPHPELHAFGVVDLTGSPYLAAATITEQGLILDRRNFSPVILPWRWVTSIEPGANSGSHHPSAVVAMRNNDNEWLTLTVPWNEELLKFNSARLTKNRT